MPTKTSNKPTGSKGSANSKDVKLKFTPPFKTKDQILSIGKEASVLLENSAFNLAYQSTIQSIQDMMVETQPHEVQKREWLNTQIQALGAVTSHLAIYANEVLRMEADALNAETARQHDLRAHQQGFSETRVPGGQGPVDQTYDSAYIG